MFIMENVCGFQVDERNDRGLPTARLAGQLQRRELGVQLLLSAAASSAAAPVEPARLLRGRRRRQPGPVAQPTFAGPVGVRVHRELGRPATVLRGRRRPEQQQQQCRRPDASLVVPGTGRPSAAVPAAAAVPAVPAAVQFRHRSRYSPHHVRWSHRVGRRMVPRSGRPGTRLPPIVGGTPTAAIALSSCQKHGSSIVHTTISFRRVHFFEFFLHIRFLFEDFPLLSGRGSPCRRVKAGVKIS